MLVAGDIGGTKTLLAIFGNGADPRSPLIQREYHSADFQSLAEMVRAFFTELNMRAEFGCFDVAGPVVDGHVKTTNLPWSMSERELEADTGLRRVALLNDLQAIAFAIPLLRDDEFETLNEGSPQPRGPIAVVAPGTGLGEAFLVWGDGGYVACASEGGHSSFAPTSEQQAALWLHLTRKYGTASAERACSGMAVADIYDFLRETRAYPENAELAQKLALATDRTPLIVEAGMKASAPDPLAEAALELFVQNLGSEAGNLALKILSTGGVYLAGGMPLRVGPLLKGRSFLDAFSSKGRFSDLLSRMPVRVVKAPAALLGAAAFGMRAFGAPGDPRGDGR